MSALPLQASLFRTSLRSWQASYKAEQQNTAAEAAPNQPTRVNRLRRFVGKRPTVRKIEKAGSED